MKDQKKPQSFFQNVYLDAKSILEKQSRKVPILKGCQNTVCHCSGDCKEIVGYRDKHPLEQ